ncbi:hypothetical protein AB0J71_47390 [Nonomuraea sp. NPDC049637]|uniref:hypothetical protein n=1 Tax=Nonomuraea sp. NPDC049637 TaxID=3154356 RepID=UPI003449CA7C
MFDAPIDLSDLPGYRAAVSTRPAKIAFIGRCSTKDCQDPRSSIAGQLAEASALLAPGEHFIAHFWDVESGMLGLDDRSQGTAEDYARLGVLLHTVYYNGNGWYHGNAWDQKSADGPALAVFQNKLYCVFRGPDSDERLYWARRNIMGGGSWSSSVPLGTHNSAVSPSLTVFNDGTGTKLYVVHRGSYTNRNTKLYWSSFNGTSWSTDTPSVPLPPPSNALPPRRTTANSTSSTAAAACCNHHRRGPAERAARPLGAAWGPFVQPHGGALAGQRPLYRSILYAASKALLAGEPEIERATSQVIGVTAPFSRTWSAPQLPRLRHPSRRPTRAARALSCAAAFRSISDGIGTRRTAGPSWLRLPRSTPTPTPQKGMKCAFLCDRPVLRLHRSRRAPARPEPPPRL